MFLNRLCEAVVEVQLSYMLCFPASVRAIGKNHTIHLRNHVDMGGAPEIVSWKGGTELNYAVCVTNLDSAVEGRIQAARVKHARVEAGGISVPEIDDHVGEGFAGMYVDELNVQVCSNSRLILRDIAANEFTSDEIRPHDGLWDESAGSIRCEDRGLACLQRIIRGRPIMRDMRPFRKRDLIPLRMADDLWKQD